MKSTLIINLFIYLFVALLPFFAFSSKINKKDYCNSLDLWEISLCAKNKEEFLRKSNVLNNLLQSSLFRKNFLPKKVLEAGKAVFHFVVRHRYHKEFYVGTGSGFFLFNNNTLFTNHHVLSYLLNERGILNWNEIVFKDQNGNKRSFSVKGVKFLSEIYDVAVLEVEGYEGPILDLAVHSPQEQSYIMGYPKDKGKKEFKIQSVYSAFDITGVYYGVFLELFDCYYGVNFTGSSGGPMVNQQGKVEAVFSNMVHSSRCSFLLTRKIHFLAEQLKKSTQVFHSVQEAKEMINRDRGTTIELAQSGNPAAQYALFYEVDKVADTDLKKKILGVDHILVRHFEVKRKGLKYITDRQKINSKNLLHTTWYEAGVYASYVDDDINAACEFWKKAGELGHPYIRSNFVFLPRRRYEHDIIDCGNHRDKK